MKLLKLTLPIIVLSACLSACGGGGDAATTTDNGTNLCSAYDKIAAKMSYDQVKTIIGHDNDGGTKAYGTSLTYIWKDNTTAGTLEVDIADKGVSGKALVGLCGGAKTKYILY